MYMTLTQLFIKNEAATDKHRPGGHSYGPIYDSFLTQFREQEINILELGVTAFGGGDILALLEGFPLARIWGIDNRPVNIVDPRYTMIVGDAYSVRTAPENTTFDIIIDDCLHDIGHQTRALEIYLPLLNVGGVYIIEDLLAYWETGESIYRLGNVVGPGRRVTYADLSFQRPDRRPNDNKMLIIYPFYRQEDLSL